MPEITPAVAPLPVAPASPVGAVGPAAPVSADPGVTDFVGQLAAALKGLKGLAAAVTGLPIAPATQVASDAPAPSTPDDATVEPSDEVPELLAALGLMPVPPAPPVVPAASAQPAPSAAPAPVTALPISQVAAAPVQGTDVPASDITEPASPAKEMPPPAAPPAEPSAATQPQAPVAPAPAPSPSTHTASEVQPQHDQAPAQAAPSPLHAHVLQSGLADSGFQSSADSGAGHHDGEPAKPAREAAAVPEQAAPLPDRVYADLANAATSATTSAPQPAAPAHVERGDVAAQIAQQVDLYRLPGNKGVRIQLHPEDLGGVQVTMRYAAGGNLELHISTEHASTAHLVEAGWSDLRDALATQGFHPERLVMSVSAPASANQMDFSSNNGSGSYRSDPSTAAFAQDGGSSRDRSRGDEARTWTMGNSPAADESTRASTSTTAPASRIDYRV